MNSNTSVNFIVLAAGKGTRTKINTPKVLLPLRGRGLIDYALDPIETFSEEFSSSLIGLVIGHQGDLVKDYLQKRGSYTFALQEEQKGTAHAVECFFKDAPEAKKNEWTFITCGDCPMLLSEHYHMLFDVVSSSEDIEAVAATFETDNPTGYGRIVRTDRGFYIREEKDASDSERKIKEVNSGFYLIKTSCLLEGLSEIEDTNASGEFYLTDLFKSEEMVLPYLFDEEDAFLGVNTLVDLNKASLLLNRRKVRGLMLSGVMMDSGVYVDDAVTVAPGTYLQTHVHLYGETTIGPDCVIEPFCIIKNSTIEKEVQILSFSHIDQAYISKYATVGPYARLRPEAEIGPEAKIGNFVEIKKSKIGKGSKVSHLTYVGDAEIGENCNIGCGVVTVNYDGKTKHKTKVGDNTFVGSGVNLIAPLNLADNTFVAAGSTLNQDLEEDDFAIARQRPSIKKGLAKKFLK